MLFLDSEGSPSRCRCGQIERCHKEGFWQLCGRPQQVLEMVFSIDQIFIQTQKYHLTNNLVTVNVNNFQSSP